MNCGSEPTLSDHCPKGHKAPPLLLLHESPLPALFRLLHMEWMVPFMLLHTIAKNVCVYDFQEKNASGVGRSTPPEVHQLLSSTWNYSASNLFWLTVPVWSACRELHNSNWSRNRYFKSKHLPSRAFHCHCLQCAELFWFYSQIVVSKKTVSLKSALECRFEFDVSCSLWRKTKKSLCVQSLDVWLGI